MEDYKYIIYTYILLMLKYQFCDYMIHNVTLIIRNVIETKITYKIIKYFIKSQPCYLLISSN